MIELSGSLRQFCKSCSLELDNGFVTDGCIVVEIATLYDMG